MSRIRALVVKELFSVLRDKRARRVLIFPPLFQLLIFALAATLDVTNAPIAILNRDSGQPSFEIIERLKGSTTFKRLYFLENDKEIQHAIDAGKALMVVQFDDTFSRNLYRSEPAAIQAILDGRHSNAAQIVLGYLTQIVSQYAKEFKAKRGMSPDRVELVVRNWYNPNLYYDWFNVPNLCGVLAMVISFILTALSVAREKELGTFDQLLVSPLTPFEILIGKTLPAILLSLGEATLILIAGVVLFRIPFVGSLWLLYLSLILFVGSVVGIGLFVSSLARTQQQSILGSFLFMTPAILLSGYATPVENMPYWLQLIDYVNPLRYFLVIVKGIFLKNMSLGLVFSRLWPIALIALFTFNGAYFFFRKRIG